MNSKVAYPFTKSLRERDKVMSEVQISKVSYALVNQNDNVVISVYPNGKPKELLLHGYYFILDEQFSETAQAFYIYLEQDVYDVLSGKEFPELLQSIGGGVYEEHECIFSVDARTDNDLANALGLLKDGGGNLITQGGSPVITVGGEWEKQDGSSDFIFLEELYAIYYLADEPDNKKKRQIWIKTQTTNDGVEVLNPHIYSTVSDSWVPLGAVYKEK